MHGLLCQAATASLAEVYTYFQGKIGLDRVLDSPFHSGLPPL